jgi:hypothetical protein
MGGGGGEGGPLCAGSLARGVGLGIVCVGCGF